MKTDSSTDDLILLEEQGAVAVITFNREPKLNAINASMARRLIELTDQLDQADHIRVVVLAARGRAFVAGADIGGYGEQTGGGFADYQWLFRKMCAAIERCRKPFLAAVNGYALGGGFILVNACDLVVASSAAQFGLPEINLGMYGGVPRIVRLLGKFRANEIAMTGRRLSADEALRLGLITRVVAPEALMDETMALAAEIAARAPRAIHAIKRMVNEGPDASLEMACSLENATLSHLFQTEDGQEGVKAFMEKRKPHFTGK